MNTQDKIALTVQYALLVASQEDDYKDRTLGPIHLIKYVYLADLAYARSHNGETFTGIQWQFYKFGPWSEEVHSAIEPSLLAVGAEKFTFPSDYDDKDDWSRWKLEDDQLFDDLKRKLPASVALSLDTHVHRFHKDTPSLLNFVYNTLPMRHAAPGEMLDFSLMIESTEGQVEFRPSLQLLSEKKRKRFREKLRSIKEKRQREGADEKPWTETLIRPKNPPRYDEVYSEGINWLESLAGEDIKEGVYTATIDESVWKSPLRRMDDIP